MKINGNCLCGNIQFHFVPKSMNVHACHCGMCRRHAGCASMTIDSADGLPVVTKGKDLLTTFQSSGWGERSFCSKCGTHMFVTVPNFGYYGVSAGVIDEDYTSILELESEVFIDKKPPFYTFVGERRRMTEAEFLAMVFEGNEEGTGTADGGEACKDESIKK
ncbi:glutathione-dependent formaldehyde-activating enzyme [Nitzschia inconspicua]|uniref:Glutathione-dependent formaldehyde-activating enzyme n=1 Tax=Nitzschia inconspicua TaxID=303405 RepID=A0A9K3PLG6_9STRA|nr:glutathione-dependent formaldehyde-activating enzyme [Nitzschia inconspicua]